MGAVAPKENGRKAPIKKIPSFVLRQDGCELSYEVVGIIAENLGDVKLSLPLGEGAERSEADEGEYSGVAA